MVPEPSQRGIGLGVGVELGVPKQTLRTSRLFVLMSHLVSPLDGRPAYLADPGSASSNVKVGAA